MRKRFKYESVREEFEKLFALELKKSLLEKDIEFLQESIIQGKNPKLSISYFDGLNMLDKGLSLAPKRFIEIIEEELIDTERSIKDTEQELIFKIYPKKEEKDEIKND